MEQVRSAQRLLEKIVPVSRLVKAETFSRQSGASVYLKLESEGPTGSFKVRGAYHAILMQQEKFQRKLPGVVTSSTGNHGAAVAYAAAIHGIPAKIYLPKNPNPAKRARIAEYGAESVETGDFLEDTRVHAAECAQRTGWYNLVDGIDAGMFPATATIGCEILDSVANVDAIFVPVGDSTLIQGVAFAAKELRPEIKIVGVQAERAPAYALAFASGRAVSTETSDTSADGLGVRHASEQNRQQIGKLVDEFVLVSEDEMLGAMRRLLLEEHVLAEPAGAASTAALLKSGDKYASKTVVLLVTGANVTEELLLRALHTH
jgi:threonine dehydratase